MSQYIGIPQQRSVRRLLFNRASETLVASAGVLPRRLYFRNVRDLTYRPVPAQNAIPLDFHESHENVVSCEDSPFIIYNEVLLSPDARDPNTRRMDWTGIRRIDLTNGQNEVVMDRKRLQVPGLYKGASICNIVAPWPDGSGAICGVELEFGSESHWRMDYLLYDISFKEGLGRKIGELHEMFQPLYNYHADTVVLNPFLRPRSHLAPKRIWFRHVLSDVSYREVPIQNIVELPYWESHEDVVSCESAPFIIYNEVLLSPDARDPNTRRMDWTGIRRFNLTNDQDEVVMDRHRLVAPKPYNDAWVDGILAAWPDGSGVVCTIGLEITHQHRDFYLYELSFKDGLLRRIAALPEWTHGRYWR